MNITGDNSSRWWDKVDIKRIDQETRRSLLLRLKERYPTHELLIKLGIKSRATLTKYLKYGRRIPDEVVERVLDNLDEDEFWGLLNGRKKLEAIGLIESETGKVDYEAVMELMKLAIREPVLKKIFLEFISKYLRNELIQLMPAKLPAIELKWNSEFEEYLRKEKKIQDEDTIKYYRNLFKKYLEGRELDEKLVSKIRKAKPWLRVVFRHYVRYLFLYRKIDEDTFAWLLVFVPGRSYPKETYISEYELSRIRKTFEELYSYNEKLYWFYRLILESGARPEHIAELVANWNPYEIIGIKELRGRSESRLVCFNEFCRYYLGIKRRNKQAGWIYMSKETYNYFSKIAPVKITKDMGKKYRRKHRLLHPSDMRKIAEQWMKTVFSMQTELLEGDSPETIMAFIQFRTGELKVSHRHYDNLRRKADKIYPYYLKYLKQTLFIKNSNLKLQAIEIGRPNPGNKNDP